MKCKTRGEVNDWLVRCNVDNYKIRDDLTVDVDGDVDLDLT